MRISPYLTIFLACATLAFPARAHVTANPDHGVAGTYFETAFRVSHGCEGSDTTRVEISLPPGTIVARPQSKPGWQIEIVKSKLAAPVAGPHGKMADEQIDSIVWKGGTLPDDQYDTFSILTKLPNAPGTLWFPVRQTCVKGSAEWKNVPANMDRWHDSDHPAPFVVIDAAPDSGEHHHH